MDSLTTVNNTLNLKVAELEKSQVQWAKLIESAKKDPSQVAKRDEEKQQFMNYLLNFVFKKAYFSIKNNEYDKNILWRKQFSAVDRR